MFTLEKNQINFQISTKLVQAKISINKQTMMKYLKHIN